MKLSLKTRTRTQTCDSSSQIRKWEVIGSRQQLQWNQELMYVVSWGGGKGHQGGRGGLVGRRQRRRASKRGASWTWSSRRRTVPFPWAHMNQCLWWSKDVHSRSRTSKHDFFKNPSRFRVKGGNWTKTCQRGRILPYETFSVPLRISKLMLLKCLRTWRWKGEGPVVTVISGKLQMTGIWENSKAQTRWGKLQLQYEKWWYKTGETNHSCYQASNHNGVWWHEETEWKSCRRACKSIKTRCSRSNIENNTDKREETMPSHDELVSDRKVGQGWFQVGGEEIGEHM